MHHTVMELEEDKLDVWNYLASAMAAVLKRALLYSATLKWKRGSEEEQEEVQVIKHTIEKLLANIGLEVLWRLYMSCSQCLLRFTNSWTTCHNYYHMQRTWLDLTCVEAITIVTSAESRKLLLWLIKHLRSKITDFRKKLKEAYETNSEFMLSQEKNLQKDQVVELKAGLIERVTRWWSINDRTWVGEHVDHSRVRFIENPKMYLLDNDMVPGITITTHSLNRLVSDILSANRLGRVIYFQKRVHAFIVAIYCNRKMLTPEAVYLVHYCLKDMWNTFDAEVEVGLDEDSTVEKNLHRKRKEDMHQFRDDIKQR
jgi:hypothetical protein